MYDVDWELEEMASHPVRVRGLKLDTEAGKKVLQPSHPVRVRGLKPLMPLPEAVDVCVAPRAGAWIET